MAKREILLAFLITVSLLVFANFAYATITSITLQFPADGSFARTSTPKFNFTAVSDFNSSFSCELFIDNTGYGINNSTSNNTATVIIANSSLTEASHNWYINCTDANGTVQSGSRVIKIDISPPTIGITPKNFTDVSSATITFEIPVNDTYWGTSNVDKVKLWINSSDNSVTCGPYDMTYNSSNGNGTLTLALNITNVCFNPGPHYIKIFANDSVNNQKEVWSNSPFIIKKVNISQVEELIGNAIGGTANFTYENETDVGKGTSIPAANLLSYNYTSIMNVKNYTVKIMGFSINETLAAKMHNTNVSTNVQTIEQTVNNLVSNLSNIASVWVDVNQWLPKESYYKYGEVILDGIYDAVFYCSALNNCSQISACSGSVNLSTYSTVIPDESGCYINNVNGDSKTHIYTDHFSGVAGAKDNVAPTISFSCDYTSVYIGETITCTCTATDNLDANPTVTYTVHPDTSKTGTFTTTCTATDNIGNSASSSITYTVSVRPSGGGGGVGKAVGLPIAHTWTSLNKGQLVKFSIDREDIGFVNIEFKLKTDANNVKIKVSRLEKRPSEVDEPKGSVYQYIEITHYNINDKLDQAWIEFEIPAEWIENNNIDPDKVTLARWTGETWDMLSTSLVKSGEVYRYRANMQQFSYFAIIGEEKVTPAPEVEEAAVEAEKEEIAEPKPTPTPKKPSLTLIFGLLVAAIVLILAWNIYRRKK